MLRRLLAKLILKYFQRIRIFISKALSTNNNLIGKPNILQPVIFEGLGKIVIDDTVTLGYTTSPLFYDTSIYIEARGKDSSVKIGKNSYINNGARIVCDKTSIVFGSNLLIGINFEIMDSNFHGIHPEKRRDSDYTCLPVVIEDNVFIGNNVTVLKGVTIGKNSVIANSSVVVKSIPPDSIAGGNPAKVIKTVYE